MVTSSGEYEGRKDVVFKGIIAATASIALMATPAMAASSAAAQTATLPTPETVSGMAQADEGGPNWAVILAAIVAVGLGLWAALDGNNDHPTSP